jgi:hypothetical protein
VFKLESHPLRRRLGRCEARSKQHDDHIRDHRVPPISEAACMADIFPAA